MADNEAADGSDGSRRKRSRPTIIVIVVAAIVVAAVVVFLIVSAVSGGSAGKPVSSGAAAEPSSSASSSSAATPPARPSPHPSAPASTAPHHSGGGTVPLDAVATPRPGVVVHVSNIQSVTGKASGVGEISGPAIRFDVTVTNDGSSTVSLETAVVNVTSGTAKTPADELLSARTPFPTSLAAGKSATAVYTFTLSKSDRKDVAISFDYRAGTPIVAFTGNVPS
ncbi:MAG: hypothetical protein JWP75_1225 [Frondihabitans sp.]|nr:hypothetical protein [Frondihabitans sp.]